MQDALETASFTFTLPQEWTWWACKLHQSGVRYKRRLILSNVLFNQLWVLSFVGMLPLAFCMFYVCLSWKSWTPKLKTSSFKISSCFCLQVCGDVGSHPSATSHLTPLLPPTFASYCYHSLMQNLKSELIVRNSWNFTTFLFDFPFFFRCSLFLTGPRWVLIWIFGFFFFA